MTQLQTRRDYLIGLGLAKPGRGKFSNDGKRALAEADARGIEFLDGPSPKGNGSGPILSSIPGEGETKAAPKPNPGDSAYIMPSDYRFPENEYRAVGSDGKTYGMRECCNTCRVSLVNHACDSPTIHNNLPVHIRERK